MSGKFDNVVSTFFGDNQDKKLFCYRKFQVAYTPTLALILFQKTLD